MSTLEHKIKVMEEFGNGEKIEYSEEDNKWHTVIGVPLWNWVAYDYRIKEVKPEPVYYYQWKLYQGLTLSISEYTATELDGGWIRIDSSKTTFEELV